MEEFRLSYQEVAMYAIILNVFISALFGLFPLLAGIKLNNRKYGLIAIIGSIVLGIIGIVLSFPFAMVMHWLILRKAAGNSAAEPLDENVVKADRSENELTPIENT